MWYIISMLRQLSLIVGSFLTFFILLFLFTKLLGPIPFEVNSITTAKSDVFSVSGEGVSPQKPDTAIVRVGVTANGSTVQQAQGQLNTNINRVSESIRALGVEAKDIQTENYNINPNIDFSSPNQRITGYTANTNLSVKVRDIGNVNRVIDASTGSGANQASGVSFEVADREKAEDEARQKAVEQAKRKAERAASVAGFRLGRMINYTENFGGVTPPMPFAVDRAVGQAAETKVEPGTSEVRVSVTLSYQIL